MDWVAVASPDGDDDLREIVRRAVEGPGPAAVRPAPSSRADRTHPPTTDDRG